jgi:hypothetical protein
MNRVKVVIEGIGRGILLHNPAGNAHFQTKKQQEQAGTKPKVKKSIPTPEEEAAAALYWNEDHSSIAFPSWNILQGLVRAASGARLPSNKKKYLAPIIAGDVELEPEMLPFGTIEYLIDTRRVVVQGQGILRSRPLLKNWTLTFFVKWEDQYLGPNFGTEELRELLDTLGGSIGLGDFRPACRGPFGKFRVVGIEKDSD